MSATHEVIFYPVQNGDTSQVLLSNGRRVLFDFCHRSNSEDDTNLAIDLQQQLKHELDEVDQDFFDVIAFTHADKDHIQGSSDFFELQYASKYQGDGRIKIKELWVPAAMLLEEASRDEQSEEFVILRQEARHRLLEGSGIRVFSRPVALMNWLEPKLAERGESSTARDHLFVDAGQIVPGFSLISDGVEFFCHSPFIKHCDEGDIIRNRSALIFNVRFLANGYTYDYLEVGDADWEVLEDIVTVSEYHGNSDRLNWNLYNIPHHCSYKSLNEDGQKGERETTPKPLVKKLLEYGQSDAYMVSSSKAITDEPTAYDQIQPPHIQARKCYERYLQNVGGRKFLVTMEQPNADSPKPLRFEITGGGVTWRRSAILVGAPALAGSTPPRAG